VPRQEIDLPGRGNSPCLNILLAPARARCRPRTMLLEAVWDISFDPMDHVVETHNQPAAGQKLTNHLTAS